MKNAIALLTRQRRKVFCEGLLASMTRLGVKASAVAAVQSRSRAEAGTSRFHLTTREDTHLRYRKQHITTSTVLD